MSRVNLLLVEYRSLSLLDDDDRLDLLGATELLTVKTHVVGLKVVGSSS